MMSIILKGALLLLVSQLASQCFATESEVKCQQSLLLEYDRKAILTFYDKRFTSVTDLAVIVTFVPDSVTRTEGDMNDHRILFCTWQNGSLQTNKAKSGYKFGGLQNGTFTLIINSATPETKGTYMVNLFSNPVISCHFTCQGTPQTKEVGSADAAKVAGGVLGIIILGAVMIICCCKCRHKCDRPQGANARGVEAGLNNLPPTEGESQPAHEDASTTPARYEPVPMDEAGISLMNGHLPSQLSEEAESPL